MNAVLLLSTAALLLVAGCGSGTASPEASTAAAAWSASFVQDRPDQDTTHAHVLLVSGADEEVSVTGVRMRWPGYVESGFQPAEMDFTAGATHRLPIRLTTPRCESEPAAAPAVEVRLDDGSTEEATLDEAGATILHRIWRRQCGEQRLLGAVDIRFDDDWRRVGDALVGTVLARRRDSTAEATLTEVRGSVLLDLSVVGSGRVLLAEGARGGRLPVRVGLAGRCDPHSLADSSQTFTLRVWVSLDGGPEQSLVLRPDTRGQQQMSAMIRSACDLN